MNSNIKMPIFACLILITRITVNYAQIQQCFVCGLESTLTCDNFDPQNDDFIKICPSDTQACSIHKKGNAFSRNCESLKLDDCQTANNVEYCYCSKNLCNGKFILNPTDDEDLLEGSGITEANPPILENSSNKIFAKMSYFLIILLMYM